MREDLGGGVGVGPLQPLVDRTSGEAGHLHDLLPVRLLLLLLLLVLSGAAETAALTLNLGVLVDHGLDEVLVVLLEVGVEVTRPSIPLVTVEPGKKQLQQKGMKSERIEMKRNPAKKRRIRSKNRNQNRE